MRKLSKQQVQSRLSDIGTDYGDEHGWDKYPSASYMMDELAEQCDEDDTTYDSASARKEAAGLVEKARQSGRKIEGEEKQEAKASTPKSEYKPKSLQEVMAMAEKAHRERSSMARIGQTYNPDDIKRDDKGRFA